MLISWGATAAWSSPLSSRSDLPLAQPRPAIAESAYTLGAGDVVRVDMFRVPQYSGEYEIQVDGSLYLPLVGAVAVEGLPLPAASERISTAYADILRRPIVSLSILRRRPLELGIAGEVLRPGSYTLTGTDASFPSLTRLLEIAGGVTQSADLRQVEIRRQNNGTTQVLAVDLWQLLQTGDQGQNVALRDGDSVFIPPTVVPLEEGALLANASFYASAAQPIDIAVVGEV
ncbi:sugar ABC transporter substrate-binding protein, partial [filamentous cyanobacterium CCP5]